MLEGEWQVVFYLEDDGDAPVERFLLSLEPKTQRRFAWSIEQLRQRNLQAREPLVRHLEGTLWELREESQTNIYRLIYAFVSNRRILLLHGFQKKTRRTPPQDLALAGRRLEHFLAREGSQP